jgi:dipeptidyl aminopeptidase/acylaminoacyl peptidase
MKFFELQNSITFPGGNIKKSYPAVITVHGWQGDSLRNKRSEKTTLEFSERGYVVMRLNLPGHGKSKGSQQNFTTAKGAEAIITAVKWLKRQKYIDNKKISIIGASIGGSCTIRAASKLRNLKSIVLLCPRSDFSDTTPERYAIQKKTGTVINKQIQSDGLRTDFYSLAAAISCPTLIVHGTEDSHFHHSQSQKLLKSLTKLSARNKKLAILKGQGHVNEWKRIDFYIPKTVKWICKK